MQAADRHCPQALIDFAQALLQAAGMVSVQAWAMPIRWLKATCWAGAKSLPCAGHGHSAAALSTAGHRSWVNPWNCGSVAVGAAWLDVVRIFCGSPCG